MKDFIVPGLIFKAESAYINMTVLHGTHQTTTQQLQTQDTTLQHASTLTNNKVTTNAPLNMYLLSTHTHHRQRWQNKRGHTNTSKHITQSK